jgi:hypothetical protein
LLTDSAEDQTLLEALTYGFRITFLPDFTPIVSFKNHKSASNQEKRVLRDLARLSSEPPYDQFPRILELPGLLTGLSIAPLGARDKKDGHSIRIYHDLSWPKGHSINTALGVPRHFEMLRLRKWTTRVYRGCFFIKVDLQDAFLSVPIAPCSWHCTGAQIAGRYFLYMYFPFGLTVSPEKFDLFAAAIIRIFTRHGHQYTDVTGAIPDRLDNYADDSIGISATETQGNLTARAYRHLLAKLGVLATDKGTAWAATSAEILGLLFDSIAFTVAIPPGKVDTLIALVISLAGRDGAVRSEISSVAGSLTWVCTVCPTGSAFTASLYDLLSATKGHRHGLILFPAEVREDLAWWVGLLTHRAWSPIQHFIRGQVPDIHISSDASSAGFGAWYNGRWIHGTFDDDMRGMHINVKEAFIVTKAALTWGHLWKDQFVCFLIDNKPISFAFAKGRAREAVTMTIIKSLYKHAVIHNFAFSTRHIPGTLNEIPDALSRDQWPRFWALAQAWRDAVPGRHLSPSSD